MASNVKGDIFSLGRVYELSADNAWSDAKSFGYAIAGANPSAPANLSLVQRVDYANDQSTLQVRSYTSRPNSGLNEMGASSPSYGYFGGGTTPAYPALFSMIYRLSFANDSLNSAQRSFYTTSIREGGAVHTPNYGYWGAGVNPSVNTSSIQKLNYANDQSTANIISNLLLTLSSLASIQSPTNGYWIGGQFPTTSNIQRNDFFNDAVVASTRGNLSAAINCKSGSGNQFYGYAMAGRNPSNVIITTVDRIDFGNDLATTLVRGPLSSARYRFGGASSSTHGYAMGMVTPTLSSTERIDFANDLSTGSIRGNSSTPFGGCAGIDGANQNYIRSLTPTSTGRGLFAGGYFGPSPSSAGSTVQRLDFDTDTATNQDRSFVSVQRVAWSGTGNQTYGWWAGGYNPAGAGRISITDRVDLQNDTTNSLSRGPLATLIGNQGQAIGNQSYGWWAGGYGGNASPFAFLSSIQRIDFGNDSPTATTRGNLSGGRYRVSATASPAYAWIAGGFTPGTTFISTVDRIDFASDLGTMPSKGALSQEKRLVQGVSNQSYGWNAGGETAVPVSTVDRIDFSNDTPTATARGSLSVARAQSASASNGSSYGWICGGRAPAGPSLLTSIERIDFGNDQATAVSRGFQSTEQRGTNGVSTFKKTLLSNTLPQTGTYGYFTSGTTGNGLNIVTTVDRIDFTNDLVTTSVKTSLNTGRERGFTSVSNKDSSWVAGGDTSSNGTSTLSSVERIDYSNDFTRFSFRSPISAGRYSCSGGTSNDNYGYITGGRLNTPNPTISKVERIEFSNDQTSPLTRANISLADSSGGGNKRYGWILDNGSTTNVYRIDYGSDTSSLSQRGNSLPSAQVGHHGSSNYNYLWLGGGRIGSSISSIQRIDFNNDLATAISRGPLSVAADGRTASGNDGYTWWASGQAFPSPINYSTIDRLDHSNDNTTASVRGNSAVTGRRNGQSSSNKGNQ